MNIVYYSIKVTPSHDPNDFECGKRNKLPFLNIFDDEGVLNENAGKFKGLRRYDARIEVQKELEKLGLFICKKPNKMILGVCSKTKDIIEPMVRPQWWVNCKDVAARAIADVKEGRLKILPKTYEKNWFEFLENIREWCVSRQIWWGHRCPVYLVRVEGKLENPNGSNDDHWIAGKTYEEALDKASFLWSVPKDKITLTQDEDVLDTWFSSGLLTMSCFGWPNVNDERFKAFYPTDVLETGHDILFFWVARMVFMSYFFTDKLPFHTVFLHPIVRDKEGRKMSKSLGNVIDPLHVIDGISLESMIELLGSGNLPENEVKKVTLEKTKEFPEGITECGADALRFGLLAYLSQGKNINLDINRVIGYKAFCNKIWNATRFSLTHLCEDFKPVQDLKTLKFQFIDLWILNKLSRACRSVDRVII